MNINEHCTVRGVISVEKNITVRCFAPSGASDSSLTKSIYRAFVPNGTMNRIVMNIISIENNISDRCYAPIVKSDSSLTKSIYQTFMPNGTMN